MVKIPYQCLQICGDILVAARGGSLHTFDIRDGSHISAWKHPLLRKRIDSEDPGIGCSAGGGSQERGVASLEQEPATKRRRLESSGGEGDGTLRPETPDQEKTDNYESKEKNKKQKKKSHPSAGPGASESPFVICLEATADSRHVVAVTAHDKTIWVFEHDGAGNLKQLSERAMPKRPCSIALTPDGQTIISADKFGDVYSLPLIPAEDFSGGTCSAAPPPRARKLEANEFTVHTRGNRQALEAQKRQRKDAPPGPAAAAAASAAFEHSLLLGHVSLLTAVALGQHGKKHFILTADRDEHIRVSRGIPQAHVIETFCLGHAEFVNRLCIPRARPDLLVSGGGDSDLFVWEWQAGKLASRAGLLAHVQSVAPEVARVAVSGLYACCWRTAAASEQLQVSIVVICERVPAVFFFQLTEENALEHAQTVRVAGSPLDVGIVSNDAHPPRLVVAIDPGIPGGQVQGPENGAWAPYILVLGQDQTSSQWGLTGLSMCETGLVDDGDEADIPRSQLDKLLYTSENLRKKETEEASIDTEL